MYSTRKNNILYGLTVYTQQYELEEANKELIGAKLQHS